VRTKEEEVGGGRAPRKSLPVILSRDSEKTALLGNPILVQAVRGKKWPALFGSWNWNTASYSCVKNERKYYHFESFTKRNWGTEFII
jgi:hypothetical protein